MHDRIEDFSRFWVQQLAIHDCDPGIYALKYIERRLELNVEQRYWLCWLYASTYNVATTWVLFNEFPDYENVCVQRLAEFDQANKGRLPYQKDQKWLRGHLAPMYESLRQQCGESLSLYWGSRRGDFPSSWFAAMNLYKVGRYTAWMFLQAISEVCDLELEPPSLELDHDSSAMHRGGLAMALGKDSWAVKGHKFTASELQYLEAIAREIMAEVQRTHGCFFTVVHPDRFSMETSLCAYRKLFRRDRGRYLGYYLDRWAEDIQKAAACNWPGIRWELLWDARHEGLPAVFDRNTGVDKSQFSLYLDEGQFMPASPLRDRLNHFYDHPEQGFGL